MSFKKFRVAMSGRHYSDFYGLNGLLHDAISEQVTVVGVATDNPQASNIAANKRVWQYPHLRCQRKLRSPKEASVTYRHQMSSFVAAQSAGGAIKRIIAQHQAST